MLADIYVARTNLLRPRMDLHRHATFSCTLEKMLRQIRAMFAGSGR